jgi:hypothetical protein
MPKSKTDTPEPVKAAANPSAPDDALAEELVGLLDKSMSDKHVKATLARANLPHGRDRQINAGIGLSYYAQKIEIGDKKSLGVSHVTFYDEGQTEFVGSQKVTFSRYPAKLPRGLEFGMKRAEVVKLLGKPPRSYEGEDTWYEGQRYHGCKFVDDKLVYVYFARRDLAAATR